MVVNRLQNGLINSSKALWASRVNCHNIFFFNGNTYFFVLILIEIYILKTTMYHKYTLLQKKCKKTLLSPMFHFALNIGGISAPSHMLLFIICFSSYLNLVITL
jgi:membrane protein CcdC involved in cytochrome C biogenesis